MVMLSPYYIISHFFNWCLDRQRPPPTIKLALSIGNMLSYSNVFFIGVIILYIVESIF